MLPRVRLPRLWSALLLAASLLLLLAGLIVWIGREPRLRKNLYIGSIPVGGLTPAQAENHLSAELTWRLAAPLYLSGPTGETTIYPNTAGFSLDCAGAVREGLDLTRQMRWNFRYRRTDLPLVPQVDPDAFAATLTDLRQAARREPREARIQLRSNNTLETVPETWGQDLDLAALQTAAQAIVLSDGEHRLTLPFISLPPRVTAAEIEQRGANRLLSQYTTAFDEGNINRSRNLRTGIAALQEYWLPPGATFSYNLVTDRTANADQYREAPIYLQGKIVLGIGGGVCQVSSTLYNAAVLADLPVLERHPHSMTVPYVPPGRDATVSEGIADLRFSNPTSAYLLVLASAAAGKLTVHIFGPEPEAGTVVFEQATLKTIEPATKYIEDPLLPPAEQVVVQTGKRGYQVKTWKVRKKDGKEISRTLLSVDTYQALESIIRVGPPPAVIIPVP